MNARARLGICAALLLAANARATTSTTAQFLNLGVGARAVAMGEAYTAVVDDSGAVYWNPAALTRIEDMSAGFSHATYLASSFYEHAAFGQNLKELGAYGVGLQYFDAGSIPSTDMFGNSAGSISPYDLAVSLGYGYRFGGSGYAAGLTAKWIQSRIQSSAQTAAVDLGALSPPLLDGRLRLALTASNAGGTLKYSSESQPLPFIVRLGSAWRLSDAWLASADLNFPRDGDPSVAAGTEYEFAATRTTSFAGRFGYNSRTTGDVNGVTGFSFGVGVTVRRFTFDYALLPFGALGVENQVSVSLRFGDQTDNSPRQRRKFDLPF